MLNLLSANFKRMKKDKIFILGTIFMFGTGIFMPLINYFFVKKLGHPAYLDDGFFVCAPIIGIILSILCGLFIGADYSDGTLRNKIIVGQKRWAIYLSNLITCIIAGFIMCLAIFIPYLSIGIPLLGFFEGEIKTVLLFFLCTFLLAISYAAIYTLITMLTSNKAVSAIICVTTAFLFIMAGSSLNGQLQKTEMPDSRYTVSAEEKAQPDENQLRDAQNNRYKLQGTKREVYRFLYDFIPGGQATQLFMSYKISWQLGLYSVITAVGTTVIGLLFFQKKDLK